MASQGQGAIDPAVLDDIIRRLTEVRLARPGKQVQLSESEIKQLCVASREIFLQQPNLLELEAPIKICGTVFAYPHTLMQLIYQTILFSKFWVATDWIDFFPLLGFCMFVYVYIYILMGSLSLHAWYEIAYRKDGESTGLKFFVVEIIV